MLKCNHEVMLMQEINDKKYSKVFRAGNSLGVRLTKHDAKELGLEVGDELIKVISDDKQTVTFKKKEKVSPSVSKLIDQGIKENWELLEWLKDK